MKLISVIEYQGSNDVLIYKFPEEEFNTHSKLIVRPSQEAIFIRGGQMADSMSPGTYTLKTGNIPILSKLINLPSDGQSPFQASVYFVNKTMAWDMKWGIPEQIRILDPIYGMPVNASASGSMAVQIAEPRRFLEKMVGTADIVTKDMLQAQFRSLIVAKVKKALSQLLRKFGFETMNEYLEELSVSLSPDISAEMEDYGVTLQKFLIDRIKLDDKDVARIDQQTITNYSFRAELERKKAAQLQEIELEALHRKQEADANAYQIRTEGFAETDVEADRMNRENYSYKDKGIIEVLKLYAANEHAGTGGGPADMLAQAPMAFAFGGAMANAAQPIFQGFQNQAQGSADIFSQPSSIFG
ncbi:MAG: SPFH domain-containing protein, partial [Eubacterium sp.]|nr:SPFH domain-containing protein [Eubacterium sp.]